MKYQVVKTFRNHDGSVLVGGVDTVDCDAPRAAVLRRHGLIGAITPAIVPAIVLEISPEIAVQIPMETAEIKPIETAEIKPAETRRRGRK